eukprot:scaffold16271_cov118-Skeletonema_dohrnii-CCMP3373.AAC.3
MVKPSLLGNSPNLSVKLIGVISLISLLTMYPRFVSMDDTVLYTRKRRDASGVRVTPPPPRLKLVGSVGVSTSIIFANELECVVGVKVNLWWVLSAVVV